MQIFFHVYITNILVEMGVILRFSEFNEIGMLRFRPKLTLSCSKDGSLKSACILRLLCGVIWNVGTMSRDGFPEESITKLYI